MSRHVEMHCDRCGKVAKTPDEDKAMGFVLVVVRDRSGVDVPSDVCGTCAHVVREVLRGAR